MGFVTRLCVNLLVSSFPFISSTLPSTVYSLKASPQPTPDTMSNKRAVEQLCCETWQVFANFASIKAAALKTGAQSQQSTQKRRQRSKQQN